MGRERESRIRGVVGWVTAAVAFGATGAGGQIPDEFTNLQVLPEDITRAELVEAMRGFSGALGVRCAYCHTVSPGLNQPDDDFAADTKSTKEKARLMLRMVRRINGETLPLLPNRRSPPVEVTCSTCHGGLSRPVPIDQEVEHTLTDDGIDAAVARYGELRERYLGSRAYDFSFGPLNGLAERLLGRERSADAVRVLELNAEFNPTSLPTLILLGQAHEANSDDGSALDVYRRILDLDPGLPFYDFYARQARQRIDAIGGG
jgi:hypothetical protein